MCADEHLSHHSGREYSLVHAGRQARLKSLHPPAVEGSLVAKSKHEKSKKATTDKLHIAVIEGDGIGHEVVPEGIRVLEVVGRRFGISFRWDTYDWNCERYKKKGSMMPQDGLDRIRDHDAIYLGAVGYPGVPDHVSLWGLLIPIRRGFQQYINLRPVRLFEGVATPLAGRKPGDIDYWIVRENNEGEYSAIGGRMFEGTDQEAAIQQAVFTKRGCDRVMRFAFELAMTRKRRHVTSATKSNGISISMPYWDERFAAIAAEYPKVETSQYHIDILTAHLVRNPQWFDVIVGSNLFGDILSDLGPATTGTIAIAPGGNINPERDFPSMFEPVHGSAPDIAGKGIANPIGQIWSGAMMLGHLGHYEAAAAIEHAIETLFAKTDIRTRDMGGKATCREMADAVIGILKTQAAA
jgi:tartrate dehydrogenase/decarboxylase / D-malate dehydrogenase